MKKLILFLGVITTLASCEKEEITTSGTGSFFSITSAVNDSLIMGDYYLIDESDNYDYKFVFTEDSVHDIRRFKTSPTTWDTEIVQAHSRYYFFVSNNVYNRANGTEVYFDDNDEFLWVKDLFSW